MPGYATGPIVAGLAAGLAALSVPPVRAERLALSTTEARTAIHLRAEPEAVARWLPSGWTAVPGTGALEGANLVILLVEGYAQSDAAGQALPYPDRYAVVGVPAREAATGRAGLVAATGLTAPASSAPGAYGVYVPARVTMEKSARAGEGGTTRVAETWTFASEAGDRLRVALDYDRGSGSRSHAEPRVYSLARPDFHRIYKADQVSEIVHMATGPRRARTVEVEAAGPNVGALSAPVVAVTAIPAYHRQIFLPD